MEHMRKSDVVYTEGAQETIARVKRLTAEERYSTKEELPITGYAILGDFNKKGG